MRRQLQTLAAAVVITSSLVAVNTSKASAAVTYQDVGYFSDTDAAPSMFADLPEAAQQAATGTSTVTPSTPTPTGYKVRGGGTYNNLHGYLSGPIYVDDVEFDGNGNPHLVRQAKVSMREVPTGGSSKNWALTANITNLIGDEGYSFAVGYECGHDINGGRDETCYSMGDGADPGGGPYSFGHGSTTFYRYFGYTNNVRKYPMLHMHVTFADGAKAIGDDGTEGEKFRGWDVCVNATNTLMCVSATY
jgi:hypothetical protein